MWAESFSEVIGLYSAGLVSRADLEATAELCMPAGEAAGSMRAHHGILDLHPDAHGVWRAA